MLSRQPSVVETERDPFLAFSTDEIAGMDKEVEDILSGDSDSEETSVEGRETTSEEDSLTGEEPRGHKRSSEVIALDDDNALDTPINKFRRGEEIPSDFEVGENRF